MLSLRSRFYLFQFLLLGGTCGFLVLAGISARDLIFWRQQLQLSMGIAQSFNEVALNLSGSQELLSQKEVIQTIEPEGRRKIILKGLAKVGKGSAPARSDLIQILNTESEYRRIVSKNIQFLEERVFYFGFLALGFLGMMSLFLGLFSQFSVFSPIGKLSKRMNDFIHNRFTYKFEVPPPHEIGQLQATFDAMAEKVLRQVDDLKSLDQAKSDFLSIASHELRTPLTSIKGSLSLLNSGVVGALPPKSKDLLQIASVETDRLIRLINELLDLTKIEAKKMPLQRSWFNSTAMLQTTIASLQGFAGSAEIQLTFECDETLWVSGDPDRIQQVLTNLISNAIKFSPKGGLVLAKAEIHEVKGVCFSVKDQGRGIAPEDQELVFEKFRQATGPDNPLVKGTGLGLAIAKGLVEQHQGSIGLRSQPGVGSTFFFFLPDWKWGRDLSDSEKSLGTYASHSQKAA